jgi:hypothetical protein
MKKTPESVDEKVMTLIPELTTGHLIGVRTGEGLHHSGKGLVPFAERSEGTLNVTVQFRPDVDRKSTV